MSFTINPMFHTDGYKLDHRRQYPEGTQYVYSNWTARGSRVKEIGAVTFFGLQAALKRLSAEFDAFFSEDVELVCEEYQTMLDSFLGPNDIGTDHIRALHNLGYLPMEFKALPEGTNVPLRVPMFTMENTHPDFFWLTNYLETRLSAELWMPMTSATVAGRIRGIINEWAMTTTGSLEGTGFQGHDFSMRGMAGMEAAINSAMGHLVAFTGTETVPVLSALPKFYPVEGFLAGTVPATEHSVMCAGGDENERDTFERLLRLYPAGIVSVVSDTWDYWNVVTNIIPSLKKEIMARDGKLVVRPDSGDPADIICGTVREFGKGVTPAEKGTIELLWETFGGETNDLGYKVLDSHIGLIYGDAMNPGRIQDICERLAAKGFAISPVVFGIGSFNYQYQTRDTFGFAMKATNVVINGEEKAIFKDPKTDNGLKKSARGRIKVVKSSTYSPGDAQLTKTGTALELLDDTTSRDRFDKKVDLLETVWKDGKFIKQISFDEVRKNAGFGA